MADTQNKSAAAMVTPLEENNEENNQEKKRDREEQEANNENQSQSQHPMWKTSLCSFYRRQPGKPGCSHGDTCRYAHSEAELRPRPDNTWDPTSARAAKKPKQDEENGGEEDEVVDFTILEKCIVGVSRNWNSDSLNNFLRDQGIEYKTANKKKGMTVGFVNFESSEQVKNAVEACKEKSKSSGKQIKIVDAVRRTNQKKTMSGDRNTDLDTSLSMDHEDNGVDNGVSVVEGVSAKAKSARDCVTPLADISYSEQLEQKKSALTQTLKKLTRNARKACPAAVPLPEWIVKSREIGGLPCKFEGILESPVINGYRNKCEFSIGYSLHGKPTVGFMLGNFRDGVTAIEEPINCPNVSKISYEYVLIFQEFLQSSHLPVWNRIENKGFWRQFTVREGRNPSQHASGDNDENNIMEVMLIIQVCSVDIDDELMKDEFERMVKVLKHGAADRSPPLPLTTIVVQDHKGISNAAPADCPLLPLLVPKIEEDSCSEKKEDNEARIHDYISNLRFSLSPTAFFQVNTLAAERLYSLAGDWARLTRDTLLFDVCCGTGTIGLTLAHRVGMVVGVEMNESAVSDAQRNAEINGITNCRFVCGKAEDVIGSLLKEYLDAPKKDNIVSNFSGQPEHNSISNDHVTDMLPDGKMKSDAGTICNPPSNNSSTEEIQLCSEGCPADSEALKVSDEVDEKVKQEKGHETAEEKIICPSVNNSVPTNGCSEVCKDTSENNQELKELTVITTDKEVGNSPKQFADVVAIVDPPRVGLHPIVIKALRTHPLIRRLVYISCNPDTLVANAIELCTPTADKPDKNKGSRGWRNMSSAGLARHRTKSMPNSEPFQPVMAKAVDLFPHTPHCEMVMLFER